MRTISIFSEKGHLWLSLPADWQLEGFSVCYEKQKGAIDVRIDGEMYNIPFEGTTLLQRVPYNLKKPEIRWIGDAANI